MTSEIRTVKVATNAVHMMKGGEDLTLKPTGLLPMACIDRASTRLDLSSGIKKASHPHNILSRCR